MSHPAGTGRKYDYEAVFAALVAWKQAHNGNSCSIRELMRVCNLPSTSHAQYILDALEKQGRIKMNGIRQIEIPGGEWRMAA